jgi:hypothetical protein
MLAFDLNQDGFVSLTQVVTGRIGGINSIKIIGCRDLEPALEVAALAEPAVLVLEDMLDGALGEALRGLTTLRHLVVRFNEQCDGLGAEQAAAIAAMPELRYFELSQAQATGAAELDVIFKACTKLEEIDLHLCNAVKDDCLEAIAALPRLKTLSLCHTSVTPQGMMLHHKGLDGVQLCIETDGGDVTPQYQQFMAIGRRWEDAFTKFLK